MEKARDGCLQYKQGVDDAADEREFLIRNQAHLHQQLFLGQAEHHCEEIKRTLTEQAPLRVKGVGKNLQDRVEGFVDVVRVEEKQTKCVVVRNSILQAENCMMKK